jgi:uncharacterized protein
MNELIEAIENDNIVKLKALCKEGIDLSQPVLIGQEYDLEDPDEISTLFYAIRKYASVEFIEVLLAHGCDINQVDSDGLSSIDIAIKFKREDVIRMCLAKGMDVNATSRKSGITPIVLAACFNNISIAQLLLDHGADINVQDSSGMSTKDYAKKLGQKKMLEFLHENGAKFNRYYQEAQKEQEDINNRKAPTEEMGFDSI